MLRDLVAIETSHFFHTPAKAYARHLIPSFAADESPPFVVGGVRARGPFDNRHRDRRSVYVHPHVSWSCP